jgi:hypothetical protein
MKKIIANINEIIYVYRQWFQYVTVEYHEFLFPSQTFPNAKLFVRYKGLQMGWCDTFLVFQYINFLFPLLYILFRYKKVKKEVLEYNCKVYSISVCHASDVTFSGNIYSCNWSTDGGKTKQRLGPTNMSAVEEKVKSLKQNGFSAVQQKVDDTVQDPFSGIVWPPPKWVVYELTSKENKFAI